MIRKEDITGLVLAGGRGARMGEVDKGLQRLQDLPMALHVLQRLQPQVGTLAINANRNLSTYEAFGYPVWPDDIDGFAGPLAGLHAGLQRCETPFLVTAPCDSPFLPRNLVTQLSTALITRSAEMAIAVIDEDGLARKQPVFCLLKRTLLASLTDYLKNGGRKMESWQAQHAAISVAFTDTQAFRNINTLQELAAHN